MYQLQKHFIIVILQTVPNVKNLFDQTPLQLKFRFYYNAKEPYNWHRNSWETHLSHIWLTVVLYVQIYIKLSFGVLERTISFVKNKICLVDRGLDRGATSGFFKLHHLCMPIMMWPPWICHIPLTLSFVYNYFCYLLYVIINIISLTIF